MIFEAQARSKQKVKKLVKLTTEKYLICLEALALALLMATTNIFSCYQIPRVAMRRS